MKKIRVVENVPWRQLYKHFEKQTDRQTNQPGTSSMHQRWKRTAVGKPSFNFFRQFQGEYVTGMT